MILFIRKTIYFLAFALFTSMGLSSCASSAQTADTTAEQEQEATMETTMKTTGVTSSPYEKDRMVPNPIDQEVPNSYNRAASNNTRTYSGEPGENYWQQYAEYDMDVELIPGEKKVTGSSTVTYINNSPDTLGQLFLELAQNAHKTGAPRKEMAEVTGGIKMRTVKEQSNELSIIRSRGQSGYFVNGTVMIIQLSQPVMPGDSVQLNFEWDFTIPQRGASGRMGYNNDELFFIAYWYPQMRVYDDVIGWFNDPFRLNAEFYHGFADYRVNITAPEDWIVTSTGQLQNGRDVLREPIYNRLQQAHQSDTVINVVDKDDFGNVTKPNSDSTVTWTFSAENIRDFAFSVTKNSNWDATRSPVGDLNGDGQKDYTNIDAIYRNSAPLWKDAAKHARHSIKFLSKYTGLSYPWPHMTAVEGGGIIGGGMEFPMMTLIGSYNQRPTESLFAVIAHELAHMWVPMQVSTNERRFSWMDEGTTTFNENQAKKDHYPDNRDPDLADFQSYLRIAGTDQKGPIMRWSDFHYNDGAFSIASYPKPASMLVALRGLLGEKTFTRAFQKFLSDWRYKHPYPWDFFNTFEEVSGRDLDWFWRSWYYETWTLDQSVGNVSKTEEGTQVIIEDIGQVPMPAHITITLAGGKTIEKTVPVKTWLEGATKAIFTIKEASEVSRVEIDPDQLYPDADRSNNTWGK